MERTETQRRILEVGKKEFLEKGFKDASLNKIVAEAGFISGFRIKERCTAKNPAGFFLFLVPFLDLLVRPFALWFADIWNQKFQCCRDGTSVLAGSVVNILSQRGGD